MVLPCRALASRWREGVGGSRVPRLRGPGGERPRSKYRAGATRAWIKVKVRHEGVFTSAGFAAWMPFDGALVGELVGDDLHYRGVVEWGYRVPDVLELVREARMARRTSPFLDLRSMRHGV